MIINIEVITGPFVASSRPGVRVKIDPGAVDVSQPEVGAGVRSITEKATECAILLLEAVKA